MVAFCGAGPRGARTSVDVATSDEAPEGLRGFEVR